MPVGLPESTNKNMIATQTLVLATVAIRDKLTLLHKRKLEYEDHLRKDNASEESTVFWTHQVIYIDNLIQEYRAAEAELRNS